MFTLLAGVQAYQSGCLALDEENITVPETEGDKDGLWRYGCVVRGAGIESK